MNLRNVNENVRLTIPAVVALLFAAGSAEAQQCRSCSPGRTAWSGFSRPMMRQAAVQPQPFQGQPYAYASGQTYAYAAQGQPYAYAAPTQPVTYGTAPQVASDQPQPDQVRRVAYKPVEAGQVQQASSTPAQEAPAQPFASQPAVDPYGFTGWLNSVRAQYGLPPVGYDPNLEAWAAQNNAHQNARGMGHYVMGSARRQNSAMGDYGSIGAAWLASPPHRSALLDPTIRAVGLSGSGSYWTFNAY